MSFIAGVVSLGGDSLAPEWRKGLRAALPKVEDVPSFEFDDRCGFLVQFDLGAFTHSGYYRGQSGAVILAGHPFFPLDMSGTSHAGRGASALGSASIDTFHELAAGSSGNWCAARWNEQDRELILIGDRLASRPLYWWSRGNDAVFASTLSVLATLLKPKLEIDDQGLLETVRLGYPLADRTPYKDIRRLLPGEIVVLGSGGTTRRRYWDWAHWPETERHDDLPEATLHALRRAVDRRLNGTTTARTFLSGGMDSRAVNQILASAGVRIRSYNFSQPGSLDAVLGRQFARTIGAEHIEVPLQITPHVQWSALLSAASREDSGPPLDSSERWPAWSGDGGSVCGGWVYIDPGIVRAMRAGNIAEAVREHLAGQGNVLGSGTLQKRARDWSVGRVEGAMQHELSRYTVRDPARAFFLFLVENDQRRHLDAHFEGILDHRLELWTPFLDGEFLETALSIPVDLGVGHLLYDRWFMLLPESTRSVPWQTYPGHVPCPLPLPTGASYQWSAGAKTRPWHWRELVAWSRLILSREFPAEVFRRSSALQNLALHTLRIRDQRGWLDMVKSYSAYWNKADHSRHPW